MENDVQFFLSKSNYNKPSAGSHGDPVEGRRKQKKSREKKGGVGVRTTLGGRSTSPTCRLSAQYNLFTHDFYDQVDRNGNIVSVKMTEEYRSKMFNKSK